VKRSIRTTRPNAVEAALGDALEWAIQRWVLTTGWKVHAEDTPWLAGPAGKVRIGTGFYEEYAHVAGLKTVTDDPDAGLLPDFDVIAGDGFDPSLDRPGIRDFYQRTARYDLSVQIGWSGPFSHLPLTLIYLVGRNVGQFDIPPQPRPWP